MGKKVLRGKKGGFSLYHCSNCPISKTVGCNHRRKKMVGCAFVHQNKARHCEWKIIAFTLVISFLAAIGGLLYNYGLEITQVTSMEPFILNLFPFVNKKMKDGIRHKHAYYKFDIELLTLFTSSLCLLALVPSLFASVATRLLGCNKPSIFLGGLFFLVGALLNGFVVNVHMLVIGRLLLGFGV